MTSPLLIVASPTLAPLSTSVPLDLTGQPEWWRCGRCDKRTRFPGALEGVAHVHAAGTEYETDEVCHEEGPFPVTVAVWTEDELLCDGSPHEGDCRRGGALTHLVEVTGPSHHASHHWSARWEGDYGEECDTGDYVPAWHTPTGTVTVLPEPIPCERPTTEVNDPSTRPPTWGLSRPSVWTLTDVATVRRLTEVKA